MAVAAQLMVNIGADTSSFDSGMKNVSQNLGDAGKHALSFGDVLKANVLSDAIVGGFNAVAGAVGEVAGKLKDFALEGIQTASDLGEVQNVVTTTFGKEGSKVIDDFAKTASTSFGLSELSAKQFTGTMGAMLKSTGLSGKQVEEMSTSIAGLSGDFASFYNLPAEEAFAKIRAGISGETEPLKQLGINMSATNLETYALAQGMKTAYKDMSEAEKTTLRYNYIMQATSDAQGDFAKTSDSYANQQRIMELNMQNLSATIGSELLPMANGLTTAFNQLLTGAISAEEFGTTVGGIVSDLANTIISQLPMLIDIGLKIIMALMDGIIANLPQIMTAAITIINKLTMALLTMLPELINMGVQMLIQLALGIAQALPTLIPAIVRAVLLIADVLVDNIDLLIDAAIQLMIGLANGLIRALPQLIAKAPVIISKLVSAVIRNLPLIISAAWQIIKALAGAIVKNLPQILSSAGQIIGTLVRGILAGVGSIATSMARIGSEILKSIGGWAGKMWDKAKEAAGSLWKGFKKGLGIGSPSLVERAFMAMEAQAIETVGNLNKLSPKINAEMFGISESKIPFTMAGTAAARTAAAPVLSPETNAIRTGNLKAQGEGLTINIYGMTVREEADIEKISQRLYYLQQSNMRGVGGEPSV